MAGEPHVRHRHGDEDPPADRREAIFERLRQQGGRVTGSRRLVLDAILGHPGHHLTAADVYERVRIDDPDFYESTVYRTLDRLVDLGVIDRVTLGPGSTVFHLADHAHQHVVCDRCGRIDQVPDAVAGATVDAVGDATGYRLSVAASTLHGRCPDCADA